jgi:hypothetical protein
MIKSDISKNFATSTPPHTINLALEINTTKPIAVLAIPGLIHPSKVADEIIVRDYPVMLLLTLLLC